MKRIYFILFILIVAGARQAGAFGLGAAMGQETVSMGTRKVRGGLGSDLVYDKLDVKFNTLKFTLLDIGKPMATGLYTSDKSGEESFWNRRAAIGSPENSTQWLGGSTTISYVMGSSSGADQYLTVFPSGDSVLASPSPSSTNSMWGVDVDLGIGQYQFLKLPIELNFSYDAQFRSYTFTNVYDGSVAKVSDTGTGGMSVNGYLSLGADLGIIPGLVLSARAGYDPLMALGGAVYPDMLSPGYRIDGGAEYMPLRFLSVFANYEQQTTGFIGLSRPVTATDLTFGGRIYFY